MPLPPEDIWELGVYRFSDSVRRVLRCDRVWVEWEFLRPSCAPPGHPGQQAGYRFSSELKRFAAGALSEIRLATASPPAARDSGGAS